MKDFYNREDLDVKSVVQLIRLWEYGAGESFDDYCEFSEIEAKKFLKFLEENFPILHSYRNTQIDGNSSWIENTVQYIFKHCVNCCTEWVPNGRGRLWNEQYTLAYYPLAEFILKDDIAWKTFVEFFTDLDNTTDGTPWIDCYDIRKDFEDGKF